MTALFISDVLRTFRPFTAPLICTKGPAGSTLCVTMPRVGRPCDESEFIAKDCVPDRPLRKVRDLNGSSS